MYVVMAGLTSAHCCVYSCIFCVHTKRCICCPNALTPRFCGAANQVLQRSKSFAAQQSFCGAAKVLTRCKRFAAPQFCSAGSFAVLLNSFTTDITSIACLYLLWKRERRRNARRLWVHETIRSLEGWCCLAPNWVLFGVVMLVLWHTYTYTYYYSLV